MIKAYTPVLFIFPLLLCGGEYTFAQVMPEAEQPGWLDQKTLTGDWGGLRTELDQSRSHGARAFHYRRVPLTRSEG